VALFQGVRNSRDKGFEMDFLPFVPLPLSLRAQRTNLV
jgi:hypothetical protein